MASWAIIGSCVAKTGRRISGFLPICMGIGGYLGYLSVALALWLSDQLGTSVLDGWLPVFSGILTMLALIGLLSSWLSPELRVKWSAFNMLNMGFVGSPVNLMAGHPLQPARIWVGCFIPLGKVACAFLGTH